MGDIDFRFYLSVLLRRLPLLLAIVGTLTALGLAVAYLMPPVYQASARILVRPPQIPADMARPTVPTNPVEQLQIIKEEITTRENLLDLARRLGIYDTLHPRLSDPDIVENLKARTTFAQVPMDQPYQGGGATVFSVSFQAKQPELAADVVNELTALILRMNTGLRTSKAEDTMQFFDKEVARLGADLSRLDEEVLEFRNANKDALPDSIDFRRIQQGNQQERLLLLEREESALRVRRSNLVRMFEATGETAGTGPMSPEQEMLRELKRALSQQLSIFAEDSPNVVALQTRINALQESVQADLTSTTEAGGVTELDLQLSDIDERLGFIAREKAAIGESLDHLVRTIAATPENETRLNALERSRANIQVQYNAAVAKLAEASTGEQIEIRSKGGTFSVVEPATPPQDPVSPNRRRIAGVGLAGGILFGLGVIVLLELLNRSVRRPVELTQLLERQPLASIPYIWAEGEKRARNRRFGYGLTAAAAVVATVAIGFQQYRQPLATAFENFVVGIDSTRMM